MTTLPRTAPHTPPPDTIDLWSLQMIEMQKMFLQPELLRDRAEPAPKVEEADDDMWDNMPV